MRRHIIRAVPIAVLAAAALSLAACGGSGNSSSSTTQPTTQPAEATQTASTDTTTSGGGTALTIKMSEYAFTPTDTTAPAGKITITAPNQGKLSHELVLVHTNLAVDKLPLVPGGAEVDEDSFGEANLPGEIPDVEPGDTKSLTVTLPAGRYVVLCNIEGHYKAGMVGTLTVQ